MRRATVIGALTIALALAACEDDTGRATIDEVEPTTGTHYGGETVTIRGSGFSSSGGATGVTIFFGDREVRPQQIVGDSEIIVRTPPGPKDEVVDIQLMFDDSRHAMIEDAFTYENADEGFGVDELVTGESEEE